MCVPAVCATDHRKPPENQGFPPFVPCWPPAPAADTARASKSRCVVADASVADALDRIPQARERQAARIQPVRHGRHLVAE
jgi:hypothetical protein